jgi:hypothetical protein
VQGQLVQKLAERIAEHRVARMEHMEAYQRHMEQLVSLPQGHDMVKAFRSAAVSSKAATVVLRQHANGGVYADAPDAQLRVRRVQWVAVRAMREACVRHDRPTQVQLGDLLVGSGSHKQRLTVINSTSMPLCLSLASSNAAFALSATQLVVHGGNRYAAPDS